MAFRLPSSVLDTYHNSKNAKKQEGICFSPAFSAYFYVDSYYFQMRMRQGASRWRRRMQEIVLVVVLRFHVLQITFEFAFDALEGVVDALDVTTQVVCDFLIAFPIQIRRQHFLF